MLSLAMPADTRNQFLELTQEHARAITGVAAAYSRTAEDRRDLSQEMLAQLWRAFPGYDRSRSFSTWMYRVVLNVAISHARARFARDAATEPLGDVEPAAPPAPERDERLHQLQQLIAELDPLNKALLLLHLEDKSHQEIADVLGTTPTNVATRLSRLRQRLRDRVAQGEPDGAR